MPSAVARHVLVICCVYVAVVVLLFLSWSFSGSPGWIRLIRPVVAFAGLLAIAAAALRALRQRTDDLSGDGLWGKQTHRSSGLTAPHVDIAAAPAQAELAGGLQDPRADDGTGLKDTDQQMNQLDRALEVGVVVTDERGELQLVGDRARDLLGLEISRSGDDGFPDALGELRETAAMVAKTGETSVTSLDPIGEDRRGRLEATAVPAEGDGDRSVVVQLRNLEQVRSLRRNLLEAARQRGLTRLYLGVAHDLRAPINAIVLNLTNLKDSLLEERDHPGEEHVRTIEMVEDELLRLQRAVESLLGQTAPIGTEASTFDVREIIEELKFLLRAQARQQRIEFEVSVPPEPALVTAPRDSIKQAILNVVVNAFDAASERGRVDLNVVSMPDSVEVLIADSGAGIPESISPRLFEMHATTKESGSGIGLFVARSAVETAGGSLRLIRTGPRGTVFAIRIPAAEGGWVGQET